MAIKFKVRDTVTKKFWNGDIRRSAFNETGKMWSSRKEVEKKVGYYISNHARWSAYYKQQAHNPPKSWEIVEIELVEQEKAQHSMQDFLRFTAMKAQAEQKHPGVGYFLDTMKNKNVIDQIEFVIRLKPSENTRWVDMDRIKEAREHLRQLGVKTRTFRETSGYFGMMDRDQAMKARLVLDVEWMLDLKAIRDSIQV